jgi:hypothetical protein
MNEKVSINSCVTYYIVRRQRHLNSFLTNFEFYTLLFLVLVCNDTVSVDSIHVNYRMINEYGAVDGMRTDRGNRCTYKKPPQCHFVHHRSPRPETEPCLLQWKTW